MSDPIKLTPILSHQRPKPRICVFCGANPGFNPAYAQAAKQLGQQLAAKQWTLVYGGGHVGMMGALADGVLNAGGQAIGVITHSLFNREVGHPGLTEMHRVETLSQRKALMADLSDAFISLPGGFGTLDELFEVVTWCQLNLQNKPSLIWNYQGYFDSLLRFVDHAVDQGFLKPQHRELIHVENELSGLLDRLDKLLSPDHRETTSTRTQTR